MRLTNCAKSVRKLLESRGAAVKYLYAAILALLVNPIQSWVGGIFGIFYESWDRLFADLAAGALFGYAAVLAVESALRLGLMPTFAREANPVTYGVSYAASIILTVVSIVSLVTMWFVNRPIDSLAALAHVVGFVLALLSFVMYLLAIRLEGHTKEVMEELTGSPQAP